MEDQPENEDQKCCGVPKFLELWEGWVEVEGAVLCTAENIQADHDSRKTEGHQRGTNGAKKFILLCFRRKVVRS